MTIGNIQIKNKYIWITIIIVAIVITIALLSWLINSSFIEVKVTNGETGSYKFSFLNQTSNKNTEVVTNSSQIKQFVPTDNYNVTIQQNYSSFVSVVKTDKLLANTYIETKLYQENKREFIGNNPSPCMSYVNSVLVTFGCNDLLANALVHIPATKSLPTYSTTTRGQGPAGYYEGIMGSKNGSFALSHIPMSSENGQTHILNKLGNNFTSVESINITTLTPSERYSAVNYKDGFIAYNQSFKEIQYFPSFNNQSTNITGVALDSSYTPISLDVNKDTILTTYSKDKKTYIYFNNSGNVNSTNVDKIYTRVIYCGESYLCMTNDKTLDIYKINNNQLDYQYSINNVVEMLNINNSLVFVNNVGVVKFDIANKNGYFTYSFGNYKYNSIAPTTSNDKFVLNVSNPQGNRVALLINPLESNSDNIDKKIADLQKDPNIKTVSIYKNYITIVPIIPTFTNNLGMTDFDSSKINEINQKISDSINRVGINQKNYVINYTIR